MFTRRYSGLELIAGTCRYYDFSRSYRATDKFPRYRTHAPPLSTAFGLPRRAVVYRSEYAVTLGPTRRTPDDFVEESITSNRIVAGLYCYRIR